MPDTNDTSTDTRVRVHDIVAVNLLPRQRAIQIFSRASAFAVAPQETVVSWAHVKGMFLSMLQLELAEQGHVVGMQVSNPETAVPGGPRRVLP